jgi:hypothetical protein
MNKIGVYLAGAFCPIKQDCKEYLDWRDYVFKNLNFV